ncbi:MAG: hypothetical protein K0Q57_854 [Gammaproteobacteria bacterium]|nr:hypothetical protein [Gammaproteobacteria bacterium]
MCLEANTKNGRVAGTYFQAKEAMDFILSQFPDPAVKERLLNDSKALLNSLTKNNGLFSKIIQSYPNKYRLKELLRTYLGSAGVLEELPRALVSSYYSVKDLEEVFKLFEPDEVKDFITAGSLLYVCLREIPPDLVSANRRGAFIYLLSRLSLEERARVLTEPNEADGHLLLNLTNLFNIIYFDEIAALLPNNEQIDCLGLSDWAKGVWRNFCRDPWHSASLFHEEEEPEENGPQP